VDTEKLLKKILHNFNSLSFSKISFIKRNRKLKKKMTLQLPNEKEQNGKQRSTKYYKENK
jgi:hypothetical protein